MKIKERRNKTRSYRVARNFQVILTTNTATNKYLTDNLRLITDILTCHCKVRMHYIIKLSESAM